MTETTTTKRTCDHCGADVTKAEHTEIARARPVKGLPGMSGGFIRELERHFCNDEHLLAWLTDRRLLATDAPPKGAEPPNT